MPTFNEIQQEIAGMLSIPDEELTPEQREAMDAYMDELAKVEADKVDGFGQFLKIQAALADACKEEAKRLIAKAKAAEASLARLKEHYTFTLRSNGLKKVSGNAYTISVRGRRRHSTDGRTSRIVPPHKDNSGAGQGCHQRIPQVRVDHPRLRSGENLQPPSPVTLQLPYLKSLAGGFIPGKGTPPCPERKKPHSPPILRNRVP